MPPPRLPPRRRRRPARADPRRRAPGRGRRAGRKTKADRRDPDLARRRAGDDRHVGPQARRPGEDPRRVPPDPDQGRRRPDLRAPAEDGRRHGPLRPGPLARPRDHRPRPGHRLHGHGQRAVGRAGVPGARGAGGAAAAADRQRCRPTSSSPRPRRPAIRRARLPRLGVRPVRGRGGDAPGIDGLGLAGRVHAAAAGRPREAPRPVRRPVPALDSADVLAGLDRFQQQARRRSSAPTGPAPRSTRPGSRPRSATTTAGRRSARAC